MPNLKHEQVCLMTKEPMVANLARDESIGSAPYGIGHQKRTCAATQRHSAYTFGLGVVMTYTRHLERAADKVDKLCGRKRSSQRAHHSTACVVAREGAQPFNVRQAQTLRHHVINATPSIVQIGMGSIKRNAILDGFHHNTTDIVVGSYRLQRMEQQRMVAHNDIEAKPTSLVNYFLGHVQTQQYPCSIHTTWQSYLQSGIIVTVLQGKRCKVFKGMKNFLYLHK